VLQATRIRLYPNDAQQVTLAGQFGCARWAWNDALTTTQTIYRETGKGLTWVVMLNRLPTLKDEHEWLKECDSQVLQSSLRHLAATFQNFFDKRGKYPRFKSKHGRQSIQYPQRVRIENDRVRLPKVGMVKCVVHRDIVGTIKTVTVSRNSCGHYYAAVLTEDGRKLPPVSTAGKAVGIDVGLTDLAVTSDGNKFSNPRHIRKHERNLKRKQQKLSRAKKGSSNRNKARRKGALPLEHRAEIQATLSEVRDVLRAIPPVLAALQAETAEPCTEIVRVLRVINGAVAGLSGCSRHV
jgi:putative transposase